jgi:LysR family transcriptional regulator, glycine cleavage system transcriptional activator
MTGQSAGNQARNQTPTAPSFLPGYLPPIDCLIAALSAAHYGSFTQAAERLGVSHAAVSRRIAGAESWAGIALFERHARGVRVTPDGQRLLARVSHALEVVDQAADLWRKPLRRSTVRIATTHSFARLWLIPRLKALEREQPNVRIEILAGTELIDLDAGQADIAIRCGKGGWKIGRETVLFPREFSVPVAAPEFLAEHGAISSVATLLARDLLCNVDSTIWAAYAKAHGKAIQHKPTDRVFGDHSQTLAAAVAGLGVALMSCPITSLDFLAQGLVRIDLGVVENPLRYYVITRQHEHSQTILSCAKQLLALAQLDAC